MKTFGPYAQFYDLLYQDKDYAAEAEFVGDLLARHAPGAQRLLELGSGTGRHAIELASNGFSLLGVERSAEMLECAQERAAQASSDIRDNIEFIQGDIRDIQLDQTFDAVIALFHVVSYQTSAEDLRATFATAQAHLKPGGIFLFDCWYGPTVLSEGTEVRVKRIEDDTIAVTRIAEPELKPAESCVDVHYTIFIENKADGQIRQVCETHHMRYLFTSEVHALFRSVKLKPLASGEWLTDRTPGIDTFGVYFAARKPT